MCVNSVLVRYQRGVALALMMWMIAAMSLMVAGAVLLGKQEIRATQAQLQAAQTRTLANGLINLGMWQWTQQPQELPVTSSMPELTFSYLNKDIVIRAVPVDALVGINSASQDLLAIILERNAGLDTGQAQALAEQIIKWREGERNDGKAAVSIGFRVFEELLQVPGMNRDILENLRPVTSVYGASTGVSFAGAPRELLLALADGNTGLVEQFVDERSNNTLSVDGGFSGFRNEFLAVSTVSSIQRVDVRVRFSDQQIWQYSRYVMVGGIGKQGFPWRLLRDSAPHQVTQFAF